MPRRRTKQPTSLDPTHENSSSLEILIHIATEMTKLGLTAPDDMQFSRQLIWERLLDGAVEHKIASMLDFQHIDVMKVIGRSTGRVRPRPRVDLVTGLTTKKNLTMEWFPTGWDSSETDMDWHFWQRSVIPYTRPSNEIIYVRDFSLLRPSGGTSDLHRSIDCLLMQATIALMNEVERRLSLYFEIRPVQRINLVWDTDKERSILAPRFPLGWKLVGTDDET